MFKTKAPSAAIAASIVFIGCGIVCGNAVAESACGDLAALKLKNVSIDRADSVSAGKFEAPPVSGLGVSIRKDLYEK